MTVFFFGATESEKTYTTDAEMLGGLIDAASHIKSGGWCMVGRKNKYMMVTSVDQIFGGHNG